MVRLRHLSALLLLVGSPAPALAQTLPAGERAPVGTLLLGSEQLARWLAAANPEVRAAEERANQAIHDHRQSAVLPNPAFSFSLGDITVGKTNPSGLGFNDTTAYTFGLSETVEIGKRDPRIHSAELRRSSAREDWVGALGKKTGDARETLGKVAYLRAKQAVLVANLAAARQVAGLERARKDAGDISDSDYERIVLDAQAFALDVARNQSDLYAALSDCRSVLTAPCDADDLAADVLDRAAELPAALPERDDLTARADLRSLRLQADSAHADAELARARAIPDPNLELSVTHDNLTVAGNQPNSFLVGFSIPIPIFDTGSHDADKAEAHARELQQTARGAELDARADLDAQSERLRWLVEATGQLANDAIPRSVDVLIATRKAYDTGHVALSDLLLAERTQRELSIKLLDLRFELFQTRNQLRRLLGEDDVLARRVIDAAASASEGDDR